MGAGQHRLQRTGQNCGENWLISGCNISGKMMVRKQIGLPLKRHRWAAKCTVPVKRRNMDNQFVILRMFSIFTKLISALSFLTGLALEGITIYGWGRLTAFYDVFRTAWKPFADTYNLYNTAGISLPAEIAPLPIWPLLVVMFIILLFTVIVASALLAGSQLIDMRITLAKEERESRSILVKAMNVLTHDLNAIASYFSSLPSSRNKSQ
jgi:hypothetical protein